MQRVEILMRNGETMEEWRQQRYGGEKVGEEKKGMPPQLFH